MIRSSHRWRPCRIQRQFNSQETNNGLNLTHTTTTTTAAANASLVCLFTICLRSVHMTVINRKAAKDTRTGAAAAGNGFRIGQLLCAR